MKVFYLKKLISKKGKLQIQVLDQQKSSEGGKKANIDYIIISY